MPDDHPLFFAGPWLDRRSEARDDPQWLAAARADPATRYVVAQSCAHLVYPGEHARIAFLSNDDPLVQGAAENCVTLLGWLDGTRCVLLELSAQQAPATPSGTRFEELRPLSPALNQAEAAVLATARALGLWRARHRHCGVCGAPTVPIRAGHCLECSRCDAEFFPRLDPAIIVLVSDGDRALLGRQASWPPRRYSTIAGFVEPGESLEDAVAREVREETGVGVDEVRYDASQPWPFPSSLMLGFRATAAAGAAIRLDGELEDARWVSREQLRSGEILAPPSHSISWRLIRSWLQERTD
ncbi:MAG: NAD(+) diphosphatase [Proteobacteria bacterium]|nr:NAD(+) diphosphatase [Pseudomonadota bacterium]